MATYINWADVANRYIDSVKLAPGSEAMKASFINGAEALIDAAAAARYPVPFSPVPELIKDLAIDVTYLKLVMRQDPKTTKALREDVKSRLDGIRDGTLTVVVSGAAIGNPESVWSTTQDYSSSFGVDDPTGWTVSEA